MTVKDISLDLETLGTGPTAAIVAIGAVAFDRNTGKMGQQFYQVVDLTSVIRRGVFDFDAGTVEWWMAQPLEARKILMPKKEGDVRYSIQTVLDQFSAWARGISGDVFQLWGNGKSFDVGVLDHAYRKACVGLQTPQHYNAARDLRTIVEAARFIDPKFEHGVTTAGVEHNALDDAIYQAHVICAAFKFLSKFQDKPKKATKPAKSNDDDGEL